LVSHFLKAVPFLLVDACVVAIVEVDSIVELLLIDMEVVVLEEEEVAVNITDDGGVDDVAVVVDVVVD